MRLLLVMMLLVPVAFSQHDAREDLQKMFDDQTAAWNRGDLVGFMQAYDKSGELTFFSGDTILKGWEATLARYQQKYQAKGNDMGHLSFTDAKIEMFGAAAAMYTARWHLSLNSGQKLEGLTTVICKRRKNGWRIVHDHSS
jgi:ketosteroid isomerase-like protein